ncbi:tetratricopeptide repeat protein [Insolitispirillum peregrinum]|uniref:Flp pilus assembly protein TadD, contains TPR repeats n=1 Tax=Insolitispirillum peregrinum TaxID=80876 RepID=A0A1N7JF47_9PROT|nr:tetratricopeptide repeat protein [Insolitispirillum peregrinum]SIS47939.1 Flp pilus assembly protein TadD, contains TPR repeats [Insolitispirillum peregrinum]
MSFEQACLLYGEGRLEPARTLLGQMDDAGGADAAALTLLGTLHRTAGAHQQAIQTLERAVRLRPDMNHALVELAQAHLANGNEIPAIEVLREVNRRVPGHSSNAQLAGLLHVAASALMNDGHLEGARTLLEEAAGINAAVSGILCDLAVTYERLGQFVEAHNTIKVAAELYPDDHITLINLSSIESTMGNQDKAEAVARHILDSIDPHSPGGWINLGVALRLQGRFDESRHAFEEALRHQPNSAVPYTNLAAIAGLHGDFDRSTALHQQACTLSPGSQAGMMTFLHACDALRSGNWEQGWELYEARSRYPRNSIVWHGIEPLPRWPGGDPRGLRILLECEQGQGDSLHFFRYARQLADQGATVGLLAPPSLIRLFRVSDPRLQVEEQGLRADPACWDYGLPLLSLPHRFGIRPDAIQAFPPYLAPAAEDTDVWASRLAGLRGLKVGLVWAGDHRAHDPVASNTDRRRSIALAALAPLGGLSGVDYVNLQLGPPRLQLAEAPFPIHDWMDEVRDFADTAALIRHLDVVVTVDTSVAHLAGGLDVPVLMLSRFDNCWRWLHRREDTPWYPRMRLFHQEEWGQWETPIHALYTALGELAHTHARGGKNASR